MKKNLINSTKLLIILISFAGMLSSCEYEEYRPADYPPSKLYMPAAIRDGGIFWINSIPEKPDWHPTPGWVYNFKVDQANNKFIVPLGVYRSGIDRSGRVDVNIYSVSADAITLRREAGDIPSATQILSSTQFSFPTTVSIADGSDLGVFDLEIDLSQLISSSNSIFAVGVGISSNQLEVNEDLATTIIVIYADIVIEYLGLK
jgi:hypothetical protein